MTDRRSRFAAGMAILLLLSGCGFQPVYGTRNATTGNEASAELTKVRIGNIPDRSGQYLRNSLIDRMQPHGQEKELAYRLDIVLSETLVNFGIQRDATATRGQLRLASTYSLKDTSGKVLLTETIRASPAFNILESEFGTVLSSDDARERGLRQMADEITMRLSLYFRQTPAQTK
jgi:LPS-assembly lipoprotein